MADKKAQKLATLKDLYVKYKAKSGTAAPGSTSADIEVMCTSILRHNDDLLTAELRNGHTKVSLR